MSEQTDGGPAFPQPINKKNFDTTPSDFDDTGRGGMSLRDWFAGQVACGDAAQQIDGGWTGNMVALPPYAAKRAAVYYAVADAMLKERQRHVG